MLPRVRESDSDESEYRLLGFTIAQRPAEPDWPKERIGCKLQRRQEKELLKTAVILFRLDSL